MITQSTATLLSFLIWRLCSHPHYTALLHILNSPTISLIERSPYSSYIPSVDIPGVKQFSIGCELVVGCGHFSDLKYGAVALNAA